MKATMGYLKWLFIIPFVTFSERSMRSYSFISMNNCHERSSWDTNIQGRKPKVYSASSQCDRKNNLV